MSFTPFIGSSPRPCGTRCTCRRHRRRPGWPSAWSRTSSPSCGWRRAGAGWRWRGRSLCSETSLWRTGRRRGSTETGGWPEGTRRRYLEGGETTTSWADPMMDSIPLYPPWRLLWGRSSQKTLNQRWANFLTCGPQKSSEIGQEGRTRSRRLECFGNQSTSEKERR